MKLNHLVTLERGHLSWFRYPTHDIGTYLGRGAQGCGSPSLLLAPLYPLLGYDQEIGARPAGRLACRTQVEIVLPADSRWDQEVYCFL